MQLSWRVQELNQPGEGRRGRERVGRGHPLHPGGVRDCSPPPVQPERGSRAEGWLFYTLPSLHFFLSMTSKLTGLLKGPDICNFAHFEVRPIYLGLTSHLQPLRLEFPPCLAWGPILAFQPQDFIIISDIIWLKACVRQSLKYFIHIIHFIMKKVRSRGTVAPRRN